MRQGFEEMAREFSNSEYVQKKFAANGYPSAPYPQYHKVVVIQDAIPEGTYGQWVSCNMIAGTAPDLIEIGMGLPAPIWLGYQTRYFEPLTQMANTPNPFNHDDPDMDPQLRDAPFRMTFDDAMRGGYTEELQEYMRVPLSRFTTRVMYNKTLLHTLTGLDVPPTDLRGFLAVCKKVATFHDENGEAYIPIVSSGYHAGFWDGGMALPLTYGLLDKTDFNRDGTLGNDEMFAAIKSGRLSFSDPAIVARYKLFQDVKEYFQPGFAALNRDDAVFRFAQQKAVFISTGTWDVMSLKQQAESKFEVGTMMYPQPAKDDPEFGKFVLGPIYDPAGQGFPFGLTRFSKHPDIARDFMLFLGSRRGNEKMNNIIGWIPTITGAKMPDALTGFKPVNQGMYAAFNPDLGGQTVVKYQQLNSQFMNQRPMVDAKGEKFYPPGACTYEKFMQDFEPFYKEKGLADWQEAQRDWRRSIINNEKFLASIRGEALLNAPNDPANSLWVKYRSYTSRRQVLPGISHAEQETTVKKGPLRPVGPYEYLPEALANLRKEIAATRPDGR